MAGKSQTYRAGVAEVHGIRVLDASLLVHIVNNVARGPVELLAEAASLRQKCISRSNG